jgi:phage regulator Rha-like protein
MVVKDSPVSIPVEVLMDKIYIIRGLKVMLDRDLGELYGVETKRLKESVRRNMDRFPEDFMFELSEEEYKYLKKNISSRGRGQHPKYPPFAFTEHGVLMLASVLNSGRAAQINIQVVRVFIKMREMLLENVSVQNQVEIIHGKLAEHDEKIILLFEYLKQLDHKNQRQTDHQNRKKIGFKRHDD